MSTNLQFTLGKKKGGGKQTQTQTVPVPSRSKALCSALQQLRRKRFPILARRTSCHADRSDQADQLGFYQ